MPFWSDPTGETKRAYRWTVTINEIYQWMAKSVSKPGFSISEIFEFQDFRVFGDFHFVILKF